MGRRCALGEDCPECELLKERLQRVLAQMGLGEVGVKYPKDMEEFLSYGVVVTPALVINGKIKMMGRVPREATLRRLLEEVVKEGKSEPS